MRTTIDLPEDLHRLALAISRDRGTTLSRTVAELMRRGLGQGTAAAEGRPVRRRTGLPVLRLGVPVSSEDVRSLEDEA